jgi:hypothetical protein
LNGRQGRDIYGVNNRSMKTHPSDISMKIPHALRSRLAHTHVNEQRIEPSNAQLLPVIDVGETSVVETGETIANSDVLGIYPHNLSRIKTS